MVGKLSHTTVSRGQRCWACASVIKVSRPRAGSATEIETNKAARILARMPISTHLSLCTRGGLTPASVNFHILATVTWVESTLVSQQSIGARLLHAEFQFFFPAYPVAQHAYSQERGSQVASRTQNAAVTDAEPRQVQAGSAVVGGLALAQKPFVQSFPSA